MEPGHAAQKVVKTSRGEVIEASGDDEVEDPEVGEGEAGEAAHVEERLGIGRGAALEQLEPDPSRAVEGLSTISEDGDQIEFGIARRPNRGENMAAE